MSVIDEIEALSKKAIENGESPTVVCLGIDTRKRLESEMYPRYTTNTAPSQTGYMIVSIVTTAGILKIRTMSYPREFILIGENPILVVLSKLGLKWDKYET